MATKEEWVKSFEAAMGRKPTAAEYSQAMANGFDLSAFSVAPTPGPAHQEAAVGEAKSNPADNRENWMKLFESVAGRKPSADEFMKGKASNFDRTQIASILNNEAQGPSVGEQSSNQAQTSQQLAQLQAGAGSALEPTQVPLDKGLSQAQVNPGQAQVAQEPSAFNNQVQIPQPGQPAFQSSPNFPQGQPSQPGAAKSSGSGLVLSLILPIVSMVLSLTFMILGFFISAPYFLIFSVLGLVFAAILMFVNFKGKKILSIIATALALLALIVSSVAVFTKVAEKPSSNHSPASSKKEEKVKDDSTDVNDYIDKNYKFDWKQSQFKDLKAKSDSVADVIKKHGKASEAQITGDGLRMVYKDSKKGSNNRVTLSFEKQYNGKFILSSGTGNFDADDISTSSDYKSDWKKEDYDALKEGDSQTGQGGTKWTDVKSKHPKLSTAYYTLYFYGEEDIIYGLHVSYADYASDDSHLDYVGLSFISSDKGKTYNLTSKYSS